MIDTQYTKFKMYFSSYSWDLKKINLDTPSFIFFERFLCENSRIYHNYSHIVNLLSLHNNLLLDDFMSPEDFLKVRTAIFWHDLIYDARRNDNEWTSAEIFKYFYQHKNNEVNFISIHFTIIDTKHINPICTLPWSLYMLDLDLSGLGSDNLIYLANKHSIEKEYKNFGIDTSTFSKGRIKFLNDMLSKPRIFHNPYNLEYFTKAEKQARHNIVQ